MITYLFGAGASKGAIPIVDELITSMKNLHAELKSIEITEKDDFEYNGNVYNSKELYQNFLLEFEWVILEASNHISIDTFAKKLFVRRNFLALRKLKSIMASYFMLIQTKSKLPDLRYDSFLSSILSTNHLEFPQNLRILSWNYDTQFEKAYVSYSQDNRVESCQALLNIYNKNSGNQNFDCDSFGIIKLNGTASLAFDYNANSAFHIVNYINEDYGKKFIINILKAYSIMQGLPTPNDKFISNISFAWEDLPNESIVVKKAVKSVIQTEVLVVIGYSFPFFNREIDRQIIRKMSKLKKVYFQAPDAEDIKERFLAIRNDIPDTNLILRKDVKQFVFPNEF